MSIDLNKIYLGDCFDLLPNIPDKSIDMILSDLPYGQTPCEWDKRLPIKQMWQEFERVIKDNSAIALTATQPFTSLLVSSNLEMYKHEWIWEKDEFSNFLNIRKQPGKVHESVLIFSKKSPKYFPIMQSGKAYCRYNRKDDIPSAVVRNSLERKPTINTGKRFPRSVISFKRDRGNHSTQKPVELFKYLIKTYTQENSVVLDICSGSGTTAIACADTNRQFICFEKDENFYKSSVERLNNHLLNERDKNDR